MFHPALWKLIQLQSRGRFRQFRRSLLTVRGWFQVLFVVAIFAQMVFSLYIANAFGSPPNPFMSSFSENLNDIIAIGMLIATSYTVLFSTGEATVYFTSSEATFLFPAPFTRKQLIAYKLFNSLMGQVIASFVFTLLSLPRLSMAFPRFLAILLTLVFVQLLTMNIAFARQIVREKFHQLIRIILGTAISLFVLMTAAQVIPIVTTASRMDFLSAMKVFRSSSAGMTLVFPFRGFATAIQANDLSEFITSFPILALIDGMFLWLAFRLDALSLEAALATSEKMTARIKQIQSKGVWQALGTAKSANAKRRIPQLPFWSGIGPVAWQKMMTTFRTSTRLLWVLLAATIAAGCFVYFVSTKSHSQEVGYVGLVAMGYMSFLICLTIQNDIERVGFLKSLPIQPLSIVVGELIGFVVLISSVQTVFLATEAVFFPNISVSLLCASAITLPFNFLLFGVDKLAFYFYPTRLAKGAPGDFQGAGKQMIFLVLKSLMIGAAVIVVVLAVLPSLLIYNSPILAIASAALAMIIECGILLPLLTLAYNRFDPGLAAAN